MFQKNQTIIKYTMTYIIRTLIDVLSLKPAAMTKNKIKLHNFIVKVI